MEIAAVPNLRKPLINRTKESNESHQEKFCSKPIRAISNFFDSILSAAAIIVFLIFIAYIWWICFIDDWRGERQSGVNRMYY